MPFFRYLASFLVLLFLVSTSANATDYFWTYKNVGSYKDAMAACSGGGGGDTLFFVNDAYAYCNLSYKNSEGGTSYYDRGFVNRQGDSCPPNTTYNSATGACDAATNKCSAKKDLTANFVFNSNTDMPPQSVPIDGCLAAVKSAKCSYISAGKAVCNGTAAYTGEAGTPLSIGDASECPNGACPDKTLDPEKKSQDCVYVTNGNGVSSCTAQNYDSNPGKAQCGSVNGTYTCIENPKARSTTSTLTSTKTSTSNSDGTVTIVKDDTVTTITCSGKTCTSETTKGSGTTVTNSSGQVISNNSSCSGKNCSPNGQASIGGGDGKGDEGEEGDGDSPSVGELKAPTSGTFDGQENDWDSKINSAKTKLHDSVTKLKDSFKPVGDVSLNSGSKLYCPQPVEIPLLNVSLDICIDKFADSLSWISDAIFAVCALIALFIVFT